MPYLTDRTRILKFQQCPRSRYYHSEINSIGITPNTSSVSLTKGLAVHKGVENLNSQVQHIQASGQIANGIDVEAAVKAGLDYFDDNISKGEFSLESDSSGAQEYTYREQQALIEFGIRGYAISRLPYHIVTYQIMSVEKELLVELDNNLVLMTRLDGEEKRIDNNGSYIYELKTSYAWDNPESKTHPIEDEYRIGMQALGNLIAAEASDSIKRHGIVSEFFINGSRREDKKDNGIYKQDSWTIRPWMKRNVVGPDEYAWQYWYTDRFGNNHSLGKSYNRVNIWEMMTVKEWIEILAERKVQPDLGDPFSKVFISPLPLQRTDSDVRSWLINTISQELRVIEGIEKVNNAANDSEYWQLLDEYFPKYTHSCINKYRKYCPFYILCHGELAGSRNVKDGGMFRDREPHHEAEQVLVEGGEGE